MPFGGQAITFVDLTVDKSGPADELGHYPINQSATVAPGCRHRPLTFKERVELDLDAATEWWRSTIPVFEYAAPLKAAVMTAKTNDVIQVDGVTYQIDGGVRTHPDMAGVPFKATIISKLQIS